MVIHDVGAKHPEHSIVAIENGHVTGRKVGDGASHVVLEQVRQADAQPSDHLSYLTKTPDGKILKSSTMYIRGRNGKVAAILGINYDISSLLMVEDAVHELIDTKDKTQSEPEKIVNVNDLLDELIAQSVALVGKPVALMNKEDKMRAIGCGSCALFADEDDEGQGWCELHQESVCYADKCANRISKV